MKDALTDFFAESLKAAFQDDGRGRLAQMEDKPLADKLPGLVTALFSYSLDPEKDSVGIHYAGVLIGAISAMDLEEISSSIAARSVEPGEPVPELTKTAYAKCVAGQVADHLMAGDNFSRKRDKIGLQMVHSKRFERMLAAAAHAQISEVTTF